MSETPTTTLYRPVGTEELTLIRQSGNRRFPPRLPEQPIFYPVLNDNIVGEIEVIAEYRGDETSALS